MKSCICLLLVYSKPIWRFFANTVYLETLGISILFSQLARMIPVARLQHSTIVILAECGLPFLPAWHCSKYLVWSSLAEVMVYLCLLMSSILVHSPGGCSQIGQY